MNEGIEVDNDEPNGGDVELLQRRDMAVLAKIRQNSSVDLRVKRLNPTIQRLRKSRHLAHIAGVNSCITKGVGRGTRRDNLNARLRERPPKIDKTRFIADGNQGPARHDSGGFAHRTELPS